METTSNQNTPAPETATDPLVLKMKDGIKAAVLKGDFEIPSLPNIAMEVMKLMNNPNVSLMQIEGLVKQDQAMAARIIKMANSSMYRGAVEITSLQQAMARIGLKNVKDVVVTLGIQSNAFKIPGYEDLLALLWEQSISTALLSQAISASAFGDKEQAFLTGLLSQIGKPVLIQIAAKIEKSEKFEAKKEAFTKKTKFDEANFKVPGLKEEILPLALQEFQTTVGSAVASRWNLPDTVLHVIKNQKKPAASPEAAQKLCWTIHLALAGSQSLGFGGGLHDSSYTTAEALKALEIDPAEFQNLLDDNQAKIQEQVSSLTG
jgi:HD-like signal output (HDOD) protein